MLLPMTHLARDIVNCLEEAVNDNTNSGEIQNLFIILIGLQNQYPAAWPSFRDSEAP